MRITTRRELVLLLLVAFVARLAAGFWWQSRVGDGFGFGDSESYWSLGRAIASGEPYRFGNAESRVFRTPGYPLLLAPLFLIGGPETPPVWGRVLGACFGTLSVLGVWWLARRLFGPEAGRLAGAAAALYPEAVAGSILVLGEAPFCPLMLANLALWIAAWQSDSPRRAFWTACAAGATAGAATLVRPSWLLFLPFAIAAGLILERATGWAEDESLNTGGASARRGGPLWLGAAMFLGLVVVMAPWWIRNAAVIGHFVPTSLEVGASLADGLGPQATGASDMAFVDRVIEQERLEPNSPAVPFEVQLDRRMREDALDWAWRHPGRVIRLASVKFVRMWNVWPNEASLSGWSVRLLVMLTYVPVVFLGILGAAKTIRRGWPYWLCWFPAIYFTLLHVVFVSSIRYRQPAMLTLIVLAAGVTVRKIGIRR
ncbi:MAG: glycosyltransferase family 39 protein [Pirellulaceae bacterium]|nr:glycosyltransferase family 39 protein [Pirellulaceae bacterium]